MARCTSDESLAGGGSVTSPMRLTCLSMFHMIACALEVVTAVRQVEGLVDQGEIRNDVADDRVFQRWPVVPGRIVRMAANDSAIGRGAQRHQHRPAPTL